jgi:AmpE protein
VNLLALFLALALERAVTQLFQLREPRWFDAYIDWTLARFRNLHGAALLAVTLLLVLLPVVPVWIVAHVFRDTLLGLPYVAFATLVLVFSFGPRDLKQEVDDYLEAVEKGDSASAASVSREIMEHDAAQRTGSAADTLEDALFVQANNRLFGVAFWFMVSGPAGAWLFRVSDLMRRRAVFEYRERAADPSAVPPFVGVLQAIHGVLAWAPARLLALGYALAGNFERALQAWRDYARAPGGRFFDTNDHLLAAVGRSALSETTADPALAEAGSAVAPAGEAGLADAVRVNASISLIRRALLIWLVLLSALVLVGWVR